MPQDLIAFIEKSPTPWHAVEEMRRRLRKSGFEELHEGASWQLKGGRSYFVVRQGTSLCAFIMPQKAPAECLIAAAHTDSPGFKLKPNAEYRKENMVMLGLEVYGGPLLTSWLNRDLGIAGRAVSAVRGKIKETLVNLDGIVATIPQLAIHLDRNVNETGPALNKQEHLAALLGIAPSAKGKGNFLEKALKKAVDGELLGADLFVYPLERPRLVGEKGEMIAGYRLDNLCSVHAVLQGIIAASKKSPHTLKVAVFWDHEEIGSDTSQGAGSPFLPQTLERIAGSREGYFRLLSESLCVSADVGHALHPNYPEKHEPRHTLLMNKGIVLKSSAQYRYATDARSSALIEQLCRKHKLPLQRFASRGDISSGTTIGPIAAQVTGMRTVDLGIAQLSMHSCRELIGAQDQRDLTRLMQTLFS